MPVAKPTDFDPNIKLGTQDDGPALTKLFNEKIKPKSNARPKGDLLWINLGELICETTIEPNGVNNIGLDAATPSGITAKTLGPDGDGGYVPANAYNQLGEDRDYRCRNRAHWNPVNCNDWHVGNSFYVQGPHTGTQRDVSLNYVLEAQAGWNLENCDRWQFCYSKVKNVWGNWTDIRTKDPYGEQSEDIQFIGAEFDRNGRQGFHCPGATGVLWTSCRFGDSSGTILHSETSKNSPARFVTGSWRIKNCTIESDVDYFVHLTGGGMVNGIYVEDNVFFSMPMKVYLDPNEQAAEGAERLQNVSVTGNVWDRWGGHGGYLLNVSDARNVTYAFNKGPYRRIYASPTDPKVINVRRVDNMTLETAGLYRET